MSGRNYRRRNRSSRWLWRCAGCGKVYHWHRSRPREDVKQSEGPLCWSCVYGAESRKDD